MHNCLFSKKVAELQGLRECSQILCIIYSIAVLHVKEEKRAGRASDVRMHVLPSVLFAREAEKKALSLVSYSQAVSTAAGLRSKVSECIHKVEHNGFLSGLDNDAKRNIAGFAGRYGIYAVKAAKYHGVDADRTRAGFLDAIATYTAGREEDAKLEDEISGYTQEEFFLDAKGVLPQLESSVSSIIDILGKVPLIGRTLTIQPPCDGAEMNPWLVEVVGMPTFVKFMTTYDLIHTAQNVLNMRANRTAAAAARAAPRVEPVGVQYLVTLPFIDFDLFESDNESNEETEGATLDATINEFARHEESQWGGVEDYSGYLAAYEEEDNDHDNTQRRGYSHRKTARRDPPPETINHLLLLPGSVGGSARPGWMHQAATYILLRNETLYYPDAWMGTMAATVVFLLGSHSDVSVGWIQDELSRVLCAFQAVYSPETACRFYTYLALMGSREDHRQTLVASADWLPYGICCPHLTKPIFALWMLAVDAKVKFSAEDLHNRHCGFLVEFFSRLKLALTWKKQDWRVDVRGWLDQCAPPPAHPLLLSPTLPGAQAVYAKTLSAALRSVRAADILQPPVLDMDDILSADHFQFSVGSIGTAFANLAKLFGIEDYNHNFPVETPLLLANLLKIAGEGSSLERTAVPCTLLMTDAEFFKLGTQSELRRFRNLAAETGRQSLKVLFELEMLKTHEGPAMTISPSHVAHFQEKWRLDVAGKLGVRKCGLSAAVCTSPYCPYFFKQLNCVPSSGGIGGTLGLHLKSVHVVPGFHKAVQALVEDGLANDAGALDSAAGSVLNGKWLDETPPCAVKIEAVRDKRLGLYKSAGALGSYGLARVAEINANYEVEKKATEIAYTRRLKQRMSSAFLVRDVQFSDADVWLRGLIKEVAAGDYTWEYEQFEAAVLGSPLVRCGWSGRFLVVVRP